MNDQQLLRYSRHLLLDEIGIDGQNKLLAAHAVVIGAGGLGSPVVLYLASAGIGKITLVDHDVVDLTNLQRQIVHTTSRVGLHKAESAKQSLAQINPDTEVITVCHRADAEMLASLVADASVVLDCTDNFATRHAINKACVAAGVPLVSGAAIRMDGQVAVFDPRSGSTPCYACLFPPDQDFEEEQCSTMGVFAPLVGIIGTMQAAEALKLIVGVGESLAQRLLLLDAKAMEWTSIRTKRNDDCAVCSSTHNEKKK
jgi:molybdopterin/thiamine biosynthesis adenylyltransferase